MTPRSRFSRLRTIVGLAALSLAGLVPVAGAQVLKDLPPLKLEYVIVDEASGLPVGSQLVDFQTIETKRGARLQITSESQYTLTKNRQTPFEYAEEAELVCNEEGITRFTTSARAIGKERKNTALRAGRHYHLTTEFEGDKTSKQITADVRRSNFGLFAAGYLDEPLANAGVFSDFPILFPVLGDHRPRQRFQEGTMLRDVLGREVFAILTRLRKPDRTRFRMWHTANELEILLRLEDETPQTTLIYELIKVNDVPANESELLD